MPDIILEETEILMEESLDHLKKEYSKIRTGRANPAMIDSVRVEAYGVLTPLNQLATITTPEARQLLVSPFDKSTLKSCESAIRELNLPVSFSNDGNVIRLVIAPLTEETRKLTVKDMGKVTEDAKIGVRNKRRDANDKYKKLEKDSQITKDDLTYYLDQVQKLTDSYITQIDSLAKTKEEQIMTV